MTDIKIAIQNNHAVLLRPANLVAGTSGQQCVFYFDDEWKNYSNITISYKVGSSILGNYKVENNKTTIPANIFAIADLPLEIALTAKTNESIIPTSWCYIGIIQPGAIINNIPPVINDEIIYEGGGVNGDNASEENIYEGGGVGNDTPADENQYEGGGVNNPT